MSDGLPSDEQLRRIERGVRVRIDARRRVVRGLVGTTAGVLLIAGAVALVPRVVGSSGAGGGSAAGGSSAGAVVRCHDGDALRTTRAQGGAERIAAACDGVAVEFQVDQGRMPSAAASAPAVPSVAAGRTGRVVVCRGAEDGGLDVYPGGDDPRARCSQEGLRPY